MCKGHDLHEPVEHAGDLQGEAQRQAHETRADLASPQGGEQRGQEHHHVAHQFHANLHPSAAQSDGLCCACKGIQVDWLYLHKRYDEMGQHHQWNANHVDQCQRHESLLSIKDVGTIHQQVKSVSGKKKGISYGEMKLTAGGVMNDQLPEFLSKYIKNTLVKYGGSIVSPRKVLWLEFQLLSLYARVTMQYVKCIDNDALKKEFEVLTEEKIPFEEFVASNRFVLESEEREQFCTICGLGYTERCIARYLSP
ncbi:Protein of unknown function [Gryllus bimaculatus]|nr:Protein of unknown function [Gryllus bimaculatus]